MRTDFEVMLQQETGYSKEARTVAMRPWWYAIAAGIALLITGLSIGLFINDRNRRAEEVAMIEAEKAHTRQVVSGLADERSPANRILAVKEASSSGNINAEIIRTLIRTMDNDPNSNVRLAAMEALSKFRGEQAVRDALVSSLSKQSDPVVQIALIQLIVELRDKDAVEPLRLIIENEATLESVKDEAHLGIWVLS
jgi:HEAT repeat protein